MSIKRLVIKALNEKIKVAQKKHDDDLILLEEKHEAEKKNLTDTVVNSFITKF